MDQATALNMASFTWVDYTIITVIAFSVFISLIRGFVREVLSLVTWVAAFIVALNFGPACGNLFENHIASQSVRLILGSGILFLLTLIVGAVVNYLISTLVEKTGLSGTDRVLGLVLGGARGVLVVAVLVLLVSYTSISKQSAWTSSLLLPHFSICVNWLQGMVPEAFDFLKGE